MKTIAQQLKIKHFPFTITDKNGKEIYLEHSNGLWYKSEYDVNGYNIYYEHSDGYWCKSEWDSHGKEIYYENSTGYWCKSEYDADGKEIYYETSDSLIIDRRKWPFSKAIVEVTLEEIAAKMGIKAEQLRIKE